MNECKLPLVLCRTGFIRAMPFFRGNRHFGVIFLLGWRFSPGGGIIKFMKQSNFAALWPAAQTPPEQFDKGYLI